MKLTPGQQRVLQRVLAFCPTEFEPSEGAIECFFGYIDRGIPMPDSEAIYGAYELFGAWNLIQPRPTAKYHLSLQEEMWLEAHDSGDYWLGWMHIEYFRLSKEEFLRKRPAYDLFIRLRQKERLRPQHERPTGSPIWRAIYASRSQRSAGR